MTPDEYRAIAARAVADLGGSETAARALGAAVLLYVTTPRRRQRDESTDRYIADLKKLMRHGDGITDLSPIERALAIALRLRAEREGFHVVPDRGARGPEARLEAHHRPLVALFLRLRDLGWRPIDLAQLIAGAPEWIRPPFARKELQRRSVEAIAKDLSTWICRHQRKDRRNEDKPNESANAASIPKTQRGLQRSQRALGRGR